MLTEWFQAGGWGMFVILALGIGSLVVGALAAWQPTKGRLVALQSLPNVIMLSGIFSFGTNLWAVNVHLSNEAFVKAHSITGDQLPFIALIGVTEAGQALTFGGLMAMLVMVLRMIAESRALKQS